MRHRDTGAAPTFLIGEMHDTHRQTGVKAQQQPDERELVIAHLQKLLTEREEAIQSLLAQLNSVRMSVGRVALRKLRGVCGRAMSRAFTRLNGARLKDAAPEAIKSNRSLPDIGRGSRSARAATNAIAAASIDRRTPAVSPLMYETAILFATGVPLHIVKARTAAPKARF